MRDPSGRCAEPEDVQDPCWAAYYDTVNALRLYYHESLQPRYEPPGLRAWDTGRLTKLHRWLQDGLIFSPAGFKHWNDSTIGAVLEALDRVDHVLGHEKAIAALGLRSGTLTAINHVYAAQDPFDRGFSTASFADKHSTQGQIDMNLSEIALLEDSVGGLVHELGHVVDHYALQFVPPGSVGEHWSSSRSQSANSPWLIAGGWEKTCSIWTMSPLGISGAVSLFAIGGVSLVQDNQHLDARDASPDEDFAETFAWYVMTKSGHPFVPAGGPERGTNEKNHNYQRQPNQERQKALADLFARF